MTEGSADVPPLGPVRADGATLGPPLPLPLDAVPPPDQEVEPAGYLVERGAERLHFLHWGGPAGRPGGEGRPIDRRSLAATGKNAELEVGRPGALLVHGLGETAWHWAPVARRLRFLRPTVAVDLRGHGLSDAPTHGYDLDTLAEDLVVVAEAAGLLGGAAGRVVLAGHGLGALVAAVAARRLGQGCAGLVLVDAGWEEMERVTGIDLETARREPAEPPEIFRSMEAFLADRRGWDPETWDADQERAARATVVELPVGRLVPAIHPHVRDACLASLFAYRPLPLLAEIDAPIAVLVARDDLGGRRLRALSVLQAGLVARGRSPLWVAHFPQLGHNLMRYRPAAVAAAILVVDRLAGGGPGGPPAAPSRAG